MSYKLQIIYQMACKSEAPNSFQIGMPNRLQNREPNGLQNKMPNRLYDTKPNKQKGGVVRK